MTKRFYILIITCIICFTMASCGKDGDAKTGTAVEESRPQVQEEAPSDDSYFSWDQDNVLLSLTESGREQESLTIPAKCTGISSGAFSGSAARTVTFEDADDIGDISGAFFGAASLEQVQLPEGLKVIGDMAFSDCSALKELTVPAGTEKIGNYAFSGCKSLKKVDFAGTSLKEIGENAFEYCALESVELPEGLETIGVYGFYGNMDLTSIYLPSSLKTIESQAFDECLVKEIHMKGDMHPEEISPLAFGPSGLSAEVYITKGSWLDLNRDAWTGILSNINYE